MFLVLISFWLPFNYAVIYRLNDIINLSFERYNKSFKRDMCCFDFHSHFLVSISLLIHIGKETSLLDFHRKQIEDTALFKFHVIAHLNARYIGLDLPIYPFLIILFVAALLKLGLAIWLTFEIGH